MKRYRISVGALVAFTAKAGDLDRRFTPGPTAAEGIAGHQLIKQRRPANYETEIRLAGEHDVLALNGRADGFNPDTQTLEEIKTHRAGLSHLPANQRAVHWAQAKMYGSMLCKEREFTSLTIALVYLNILTGDETIEQETYVAEELASFFQQQCQIFLAWAQQETTHREARDAALMQLRFPYPQFRTGQRALAVNVFRAARDEQTLLAQATTGIGKTLATLYPQLRAMGECARDRVIFLTAKTPGRQLALEAMRSIHDANPALPLRVLEYVSREKACVYPDRACHGDSCPLAQGFYDRLPAAREDAATRRWLTHEEVKDIARRHSICPYYLAQEMARWSDVFVGDYNYYFDLSALMYAFTTQFEWQVTVLVDEAHNLIDRARAMYSSSLSSSALVAARAAGPARLRAGFDRAWEAWHKAFREQTDAYRLYETIPADLVKALQRLASQINDHLSEKPEGHDAAFLEFYFEVSAFLKLADVLGDHSIVDVEVHDPFDPETASTLSIRNILPAPFLEKRFQTAASTTLFSATLQPAHYFQDMLGLPANTGFVDVPSPFQAEQLQVLIDTRLSTRYADRGDSLERVVERIATQFSACPGNYMAFFSSYAYLQEVHTRFNARYPDIPTRVQSGGMGEQGREDFLAAFSDRSQQVGFCVLGGAFGEGVDLPGARLIGVFITTLGMPAISPVNEEIRRRMEQRFGKGFEYAYFIPGMQKVIQAAGRVIRTETDTGVVMLLDKRYTRLQARAMMPGWWRVNTETGST
ncbi:MAG: ATP-dependent DNA helicase [Moraxellaceae bacterium]|nr:ATP-dependent DNA helicase [Moraxellaceae bacterium]